MVEVPTENEWLTELKEAMGRAKSEPGIPEGYQTLKRIAEDAGMSWASARKALRRLYDDGKIEVSQGVIRKMDGKTQTAPVYRLKK